MNVRLDLIVVEGDFDETTLSDDLLRRHRDMIHDGTSPPVLRRARFSGKYMMSAEEHDDPCSPTSPRVNLSSWLVLRTELRLARVSPTSDRAVGGAGG